ncbi:MAG: hypothetical protein EZS28_003482 [Streblomastix strix]|uniref:Uncharacterized protein n=1 Tax=Streblomastix strix TaxID=222440 RepID=A0A5J4X3D1_9EUKA|nr:MAG: hypothetical protein EZS28_003482 [Streblomastix strix]
MDDLPKEKEHINQIQDSRDQENVTLRCCHEGFCKVLQAERESFNPTSERANKLERERLLERSEDIADQELNEKEVIGCSGENDLKVEVETQRFAVLAQHACVAAEAALIFGDVREATNNIYGRNHSALILPRYLQPQSPRQMTITTKPNSSM